MNASDWFGLLHPFLAVVWVYPLLGIVTLRAWQTRQRRLEIATQKKSKIAPAVGPEHVQIGKILSASVVGASLLGISYAIFSKAIANQSLGAEPFLYLFIGLLLIATVTSLVLLYRAKPPLWRGIFATLTGLGVVILGCQEGVYRRGSEWYWSHYYYGVGATLLMIFSLAIVQDIYRDRTLKWRITHVVLNCFALFLFVGQGFTGARDLLEIPLSWQKPLVYQCDYQAKTCPPLADPAPTP
ncbi:MAG: hypothetical protein RLZZ490_425 [Cyanobacteriota bacterium]|jgi:hypothetical protein